MTAIAEEVAKLDQSLARLHSAGYSPDDKSFDAKWLDSVPHGGDERKEQNLADPSQVDEHLQAARTYLLGGMPREYRTTLGLALDALDEIDDQPLREAIRPLIRSLLEAKV